MKDAQGDGEIKKVNIRASNDEQSLTAIGWVRGVDPVILEPSKSDCRVRPFAEVRVRKISS